MEKTVRWTLIVACMGLVLWIRTLPLSLHAADEQAEQLVRRHIRIQLAREAAQKSLPAPGRQQVKEWIRNNTDKFAEQKAAVAQRLKSRLRYTGSDGQEYVYLGGVDSYLWLRHARNYLRTGTTCDAIVNGECRDTYGMAPLGMQMLYQRSLHTAAIVGLHTLITRFKPDYPLPASAFLVPVIIGTLGVLPAFGIGWGLAGNAGGLAAALLVSLQPVFLSRSISSDNDVWNVVLPLFVMWAALTGLSTPGWRRQIIYLVLAAVCVGLQAGVWRGWFFAYTVLLLGLLGRILLSGIQYGFQAGTVQIWRGREVQNALLGGAVFYVAAGVFTAIAGSERSYFSIPYQILAPTLERAFVQPSVVDGGDGALWPDALMTVSELAKPTLWGIIDGMGGPLFFCVGLLGLLLLVLPRNRWHWYHWVMLAVGFLFDGYLFTKDSPGRLMAIGLIAVPLVCGLFLRLLDEKKTADLDSGPELVVIVWFLASLYSAYDGIRFLLLTGPACGVAFAITVGRLYTLLSALVQQQIQTWHRWPVHALLCALVAMALFHPLREGYDTARDYIPQVSGGWWDTLTKIRDESAPDAIVSTWWDYGHWAKYAAERRVSADGSSLLTHVPHWLGLVLASPNERESVGVLRMLDCGSDASPVAEKQQGAYDKVLTKVKNVILAHTIITDLVKHDATQARAYLAQRDFTAAEQDDILLSTHCVPPEAYLVLSSEQILKTGVWMHLGLWDFRRAYIARRALSLPEEEAVPDLVERFGYKQEEATRLYKRAQALDSSNEVYDFIAPRLGYLSPQWISCHTEGDDTSLVCPVGLQTSRTGSVLEKFVYRAAAPLESKIHFRLPRSMRSRHYPSEGTPGLLIVAGVQEQEEVFFPSPTFPRLGVLLDVPKKRILLGPPPLLRSTFTHLIYLDGRYSQYYEKFDERLTYAGERVVTWKVKWDGQKGPLKENAAPPLEPQLQGTEGSSNTPMSEKESG
ncbi:MAG TPA: STT3 domain-containing protein [Candidatus Binatia bacterium]|nr:STT3 domain-containing protein [Candidatus Binatia bacterium]